MPRTRDPKELFDAAVAGDRAAVARLLSVVERGGPAARDVSRLVFPRCGDAYTVGITGAPGAGKSTLTDQVITTIRGAGEEVGVLAVDPSSPFSGGAILGDRVRMQDHALDQGVFIRSMATRGHLGGLTLATREAIRVLDASGFRLVLVETVGVGQVEVEIAQAADTTVVVVNPGWGDAVQANKAGLLEIADVFVINKADRPGVRETERDLKSMLSMSDLGDWTPPIVPAVASTGEGVADVWAAIGDHRRHLEGSGLLEGRRRHRLEDELREIVVRRLEQEAYQRCADAFERLLVGVLERRVDPYSAADELVETLRGGED
ncbi:MAG TPA: methylmalonyl Co-A mutase-associated GTPase MeaB [Acidimicrobiales bacterium]|nr:methylmalonyl Co-A mutase-associated GTPase MeaB [Acidimicrobiales bacterium]